MNDQANERIELDDKDVADIDAMMAETPEPEFHTVLEVWREVLSNAPELAKEKVSPQWAARMVSSYGGVTFRDCEDLQDQYFAKIMELSKILDAEIETDKDCLTYRSPEDDAVYNSLHYKQILKDWQCTFLQWELDWNTTDPYAAVELAAISEVYNMFFSPTGLTAYLDNIKFEYTEADQLNLQEALLELREGQGVKDE